MLKLGDEDPDTLVTQYRREANEVGRLAPRIERENLADLAECVRDGADTLQDVEDRLQGPTSEAMLRLSDVCANEGLG